MEVGVVVYRSLTNISLSKLKFKLELIFEIINFDLLVIYKLHIPFRKMSE